MLAFIKFNSYQLFTEILPTVFSKKNTKTKFCTVNTVRLVGIGQPAHATHNT